MNVELTERETVSDTNRQAKIEKIISGKLSRLKNPNSIILAPKSREIHFMVQMLITLDKAINFLRINVGTAGIPVSTIRNVDEQLMKYIESVRAFNRTLTSEMINNIGNMYYTDNAEDTIESPQIREMLAKRKNTYVFVPNTLEVGRLAVVVKNLDYALCEFKSRNPLGDIEKFEIVVNTMGNILKDLSILVSSLVRMAHSPKIVFIPPKGLKSHLKALNLIEDNGEGH